ncbi:MAG: hypothetical protein COB15_07885 [Flavobacteriales bacterium]|nr:MAG: hypothetical protein COB15_07885 [Flavobacteriales bacterium]
MQGLKRVLGLLMILSILASCSKSDKVISGNLLQKRKYNKGFFVDRKSKKDFKVNSYKTERTTDKLLSTYTAKTIEIDQYKSEVEVPEYVAEELTASIGDDAVISQLKDVKSINPLLDNYVEQVNVESKLEEEEVAETKIEKLGMWGFFVSLVPVAGAGSIMGLLLPGLAAIIMCTISLLRISKNPSQYRKKGLTYWGLALGILSLFVGIALLAMM